MREGLEFAVASRVPAVGGQVLSLQGLRARYDEVFLPLYGAHQAQNAVDGARGGRGVPRGTTPLGDDVVREAFARVTSPGRLEIIRRSPMILLDAAHNPARRRGDGRGARGLVRLLPADRRGRRDDGQGRRGGAGRASSRTWPTSSVPRTPPSGRCRRPTWPAIAREVFGPDRVSIAPRLADAIDEGTALAEAGEALGSSIGTGAVLVTGSVVTVGEARALLRRRGSQS